VTDPFGTNRPSTDCIDDDLAIELAFGTIDGRERARTLAHLVGCGSCRTRVDALRAVSDSLLLLAPPAEPPAGFEHTVLARLRTHAGTGLSHGRRAMVTAAALLVVVAAAGLGYAVDRRDPAPAMDLASAVMQTTAGLEVGTVWRHPGDPAWLFVSVPGWRRWEPDGTAPREYQLEITLADGRRMRIADAFLRPADGTWATTLTVDADDVTSVAVIDDAGRIWCTGTFTRET
jgi:hypothetical protein